MTICQIILANFQNNYIVLNLSKSNKYICKKVQTCKCYNYINITDSSTLNFNTNHKNQ